MAQVIWNCLSKTEVPWHDYESRDFDLQFLSVVSTEDSTEKVGRWIKLQENSISRSSLNTSEENVLENRRKFFWQSCVPLILILVVGLCWNEQGCSHSEASCQKIGEIERKNERWQWNQVYWPTLMAYYVLDRQNFFFQRNVPIQ